MTKPLKLKINSKVIVFIAYIILLIALYKSKLIPNDLQSLKKIILSNPNSTLLTFMLLSILRIFIGIPGSVFCVIGGLVFAPFKAVLYSMTAYIISLVLVFVIGRYFFGNKLRKWLLNKSPNLHQLINSKGTKFFAIALLCPVAPGDLICLLLSTLDVSFLKYIIIIFITHLPWVIIYSLLGYSFHLSALTITVLLSVALLITFFSIKGWNKIKTQKGYTKGL